jgi:flagellar protein FliS
MTLQGTYVAPADQEILSAKPEQLTLMLYNGAIGFLNDSIAAINNNDSEKAQNANDRVQSILRELASTLDMNYDLSKNLGSLYEYMEYRLQSAKLRNEITMLEEVKSLLTELRDTWEQAIRK